MLRSLDHKPKQFQVILAALVWMLCAGQGLAQIVSVKCCISKGNLARIGECLSGPGDTTVPLACGSIGTCVLGFGEDTTFMGKMCDSELIDIPDEPRAVCKSWVAPDALVSQECVASTNTDFNLFETFDADLDGDLDLWDIAVFQRNYLSLPKQIQSDARLVFVECCTPALEDSEEPNETIDGGVAANATTTGTQPTCTLGFSGIIEPGDYLYRLCQPTAALSREAGDPSCVSWNTGAPVVYFCEAVADENGQCPTKDGASTNDKAGIAPHTGLEISVGPPTHKR